MSLKLQTKLAITALLAVLLFGCRGSESGKPPIHLNPNMDLQGKYKAQEESKFFADGRTMRPIEKGVIPYGDQYQLSSPDPDFLKADQAFYEGKDASGKNVTTLPSLEKLGFKTKKAMLKRGGMAKKKAMKKKKKQMKKKRTMKRGGGMAAAARPMRRGGGMMKKDMM